ncbi:MAG: histidine phosphatase family protein [Pelolinea sp.]|nr:histidine phosphatase family protein [Pelolinea sp.]
MKNQFQGAIFTRLFLIRHGQTEWNKKKMIQGALDIPLNQEGIQQAKTVSKKMSDHYPFDVLFSSPAERALKTAQMINGKSNREILVDPDLIEIDFGSLTNHTLDDLESEQAEYIEKFNHFISTNRDLGTIRPELPDGEPIAKIEDRIHSFLNKILLLHKGQKIAVVSHGSFLKCLITSLSGGSLKNYMPYWIENASISIVDFYGHLPIIRVLNDSSHLDQPLDFAVPRII